MDVWTSQSNPGKQLVLAVVCAIAGLLLAVGFRDFSSLNSNDGAGFLLGVLLLILGVAGFLVSGRQTVVVDPKTHSITIDDSTRFNTQKKTILFNNIVSVSIGYLGKTTGFVTWYYLVLKLRSGEEYSLFPPGRFYKGGSDRSTMAGWKHRLEKYLNQ